MLSITDILDFVDLDRETINVIGTATQLPSEETITLARQLLATEQGVSIVHHMYRDQIANASASRKKELHQAYLYFSRKYPLLQSG